MNQLDYFVPDRDPRAFYPLASYLPLSSASVARAYIEQLTAPGDLVLTPFACSPTIARVAHALNRRVIAMEANPLWAWLARAMATLPGASQIDAALAQLGDARKDDTSLRAHLNQLYATTCAACSHATPVEYFVHTRGAGITTRHYTCAHCGATRDDPPDESDLQRASAFQARGLHFHLAFERVAPDDHAHDERIRKMLDVYTPRNLYALVTLTQKIDSLFHATRERDILLLLLLHLLDRGASFYADAKPDTRARLTAHKQFVELNLWREIELAARELGRGEAPLDLAESPRAIEDAQVFIGHASARSLARAHTPESAALVIGALPTRRIAVWTLSYLWGAWVLGRAAAQSLAPFLATGKDAAWERRWYFDSLAGSMNALAKLARADAHIVFAFNETWHEVIESLLLASAGASFNLEALLYQPRLGEFPKREFDDVRGEYRVTFTRGAPNLGEPLDARALDAAIRATTLDAARTVFARRADPLTFSHLHHAAYQQLARAGLLAQAMRTKFRTPPGKLVHDAVVTGLREGYAHDFDHYHSQTQLLWLTHTPTAPPLIERVEDAVREILARGAPVACAELEDAIYRAFPGDLTPDAGMIAVCASAYADVREGAWHWRGDDATKRAHALDVLARLGERLGYQVQAADGRWQMANGKSQIADAPNSQFDLMWLKDNDLACGFVWRARAQFTDLAQVHIAPARGYVVVPETQVALLGAKTRCLPHRADAFHEAGWHFVRVPFAAKLLAAQHVEPSDLALIEGLTPPVAEPRAQLELL
ncbi:MAG: hypothetical protein HY868_10010 [Chloroflexi bacterium]|nr:hypothetical protein [Chloroflexota bacterium]